MQPTIESLSLIKKRVTLTIPAAALDQALANAVTEAAKDPASLKLLTRKAAQVGKLADFKFQKVPEEFTQYTFQQVAPGVIEKMIQTSFQTLLEQKQFIPISEFAVESTEKNARGDLTLIATFDVMPDPNDICIDIPAMTMDAVSFTEEEVQNSIEQLRLLHVNWTEVHKAAQRGNKITIDLHGEMQGKAFPEGQAENMEIALGMDMMMPGFQEQLLGLQPGAKKIFDLAYPADYPDPKLAGKLATFSVIVKKVYDPVLPPIDEHLVKACGVASGKLEDLIQKIRQNLLQHKTIAAQQELKQKVFDALLQKNNFVVSQKMLDDEQKRIEQQADIRLDPERTVRLSLLVSSLIKKFALTPDPVRVKQHIEEYAMLYKDAERIKQSIYNDAKQLADMQILALESQLVEKLLSPSLPGAY